jgi:hypothetical protein
MSTLGYFDYLGSTPLDPRVRDVIVGAWDNPGNSSAQDHAFGWRAAAAVQAARQGVADALDADAEEITFTSGATEANNILILGAARTAPAHRRRILVSPIEHKSVLSPAEVLTSEGFELCYVALDDRGRVDLEALQAQLDDTVAIVSIMAVNNEIGVIQDIATLSPWWRALEHFSTSMPPKPRPPCRSIFTLGAATVRAYRLIRCMGRGGSAPPMSAALRHGVHRRSSPAADKKRECAPERFRTPFAQASPRPASC